MRRCAIEALNHALAGHSRGSRALSHLLGQLARPAHHRLPLRDIVDVMLRVNAQAYSVEAGNVRHEHEWKVWRDVKLPDGKILIPGVVSHATNVVEHPELVADRIVDYAQRRRARERHRRHRLRAWRAACIRSSPGPSSRRWSKARSWRAWSCGAEAR